MPGPRSSAPRHCVLGGFLAPQTASCACCCSRSPSSLSQGLRRKYLPCTAGFALLLSEQPDWSRMNPVTWGLGPGGMLLHVHTALLSHPAPPAMLWDGKMAGWPRSVRKPPRRERPGSPHGQAGAGPWELSVSWSYRNLCAQEVCAVGFGTGSPLQALLVGAMAGTGAAWAGSCLGHFLWKTTDF